MHNKKTQPPIESFVRRNRPLFVTLFVLVPIIVMPVLLIYSFMRDDRFQQWRTLHVVYENAQGLNRGNQVSMSGMAIGHVREVELIREGVVHVSFDVNSRYQHLVRRDTRVRMRQRGFVGDWELELTGGTAAGGDARDNDTLQSERVQSLDNMIELATGVIDTAMMLFGEVAAILRGIEAGEGTVGQVLKNDTLFRNINQISANAVTLSSSVNAMMADVKGIMTGADSLLATLNTAGRDGITLVDSVTALVNSVNSSLADVMTEVDGILKNARTVSDATPGLFNRLMDDLGEVETMLRGVQDGPAGRMLFGAPAQNPHLADTP